MTQKNHSTGDGAAIRIPTGEEIYNALMVSIEPELTTPSIPLLDEKYKDENAADRTARLERYCAAYEAYDIAYEKWIAEFNQLVNAYRKEAMRSAEVRERKQEVEMMAHIESQFEHTLPTSV